MGKIQITKEEFEQTIHRWIEVTLYITSKDFDISREFEVRINNNCGFCIARVRTQVYSCNECDAYEVCRETTFREYHNAIVIDRGVTTAIQKALEILQWLHEYGQEKGLI